MAVCTRGNRRREHVNPWEKDGDCRRTTNGGRWRRTTVASARIRMTGVKRRTRRSWPEAARDSMPCSAVAAPMMASMHDWKPTDSTGRHQRVIRPVDGSTTLVEAGKLSIVKAVARSREHFPFGVSGSDDSKPCPASAEIDRRHRIAANNGPSLDHFKPTVTERGLPRSVC